MSSLISLVVGDTDEGTRLDVWLARQLPQQSRARLQALILAGAVVRSDDRDVLRPALRVHAGQCIEVHLPDAVPAEPQPEDMPLTIVHQDAHLLVIDKPAGLIVHPGAGAPTGTLVNALLHHVRDLSGIGGVLRPGIVHRLDKGTSGLLVVAKDDQTHRQLSRQFSGRTVEKEYMAIVHGTLLPAHGVIKAPIGRDPQQRQRMCVRQVGGRAAHSSYAQIEALDGTALVRIRIHTGRTHQVRVHMASIGHPLVGDATYGGRRTPACRQISAREAAACFPRPALHAARLAFTHPHTQERLTFASALPADMLQLILALRPAGPRP